MSTVLIYNYCLLVGIIYMSVSIQVKIICYILVISFICDFSIYLVYKMSRLLSLCKHFCLKK